MIRSEFFADSSQIYKDSLMEIIKQTILKQDLMFRMQVHELHRLYRVQKFLSREMSFGVVDELISQVPPPDETTPSLTDKRAFDLRLSADEFISNITDDFVDHETDDYHLRQPVGCADSKVLEGLTKNCQDAIDGDDGEVCCSYRNKESIPSKKMKDSCDECTESCSSALKNQIDLNQPFIDEASRSSDDGDDKAAERTAANRNNDQESPETLQRAAESLIYLSTAISATDRIQIPHEEEPQPSMDSFEHNVLKLTEVSQEGGCVSSSPAAFFSDDRDKDYGCLLRRGRRMKDFQKEILPSMASLAVQEIREDISIMEGVLRSREYRRRRAMMESHDQGWSKIKRSRRSKLKHTKRRIFS